MKDFLRSPSLFFGVPLMASCVMAVITFDLPADYWYGLVLLMALALLTMGMDGLLGIRLPTRECMRKVRFSGSCEAHVAIGLAILVFMACTVDLTLFPLPILDPAIYATFDNGRAYVRHISNMCWILPVIGIVCVRNYFVRFCFIAMGLLFPVLVLDRNRLFASVFSLMVVWVYFSKKASWKTVFSGGAVTFAVFSQLGNLRSGRLDWVFMPFSDIYMQASSAIKWIMLYVSAGVYNFSSIVAKGYINSDFLINQLVPGAGSVATLGSNIPLDEPVINVGTEYFPFLMSYGPAGAFLAALFLFFCICVCIALFKRHISPFSFLIFLRISYVGIMAPFAPQAFTWTTFGFIALCVMLMISSSLLSGLFAARHVHDY